MKTLLIFTLGFLLLTNSSSGQVPHLEDHWWFPNGTVYAIEHDSVRRQIYLGGDFSAVVPPVQYNAFLGRESGIPDLRFPKITNGFIASSVSDGNGGYYIGGSFTKVGDSIRNRIAHIDQNGMVTSKFTGNGFNNNVKSMQLQNDSLVVLGAFNSYGQIRKYAALINPATGTVINSFPELNGTCTAVAEDGHGGYFLAGYFTMVGDSLRSRLAHIDSSMNVTSWKPELTGSLYCMAVRGDTVFVGGSISMAAGQPRANLAAFHATTGNLVQWNPTVSGGYVSEMAIHNNTAYIMGNFSDVNNSGPPYFSAVDITTGNTIVLPYTSMFPFEYGSCDLNIVNDTAYVGGYFSMFYNQPRNNIVAIDLNSFSLVNWFTQGVDSTVNSIAYSNGRMVIAGRSDYITTYNFTTGMASSKYLLAQKYEVTICGDTAFIGTNTFDHTVPLYALNLLTNNFINLNYTTTGSIFLLKRMNANLFVSGSTFEAVLGPIVNQVCQFNATSGMLLPWNAPPLNGTTSDMLLDGNDIFLCGKFTSIGDSARFLVGVINRFNAQVTPWKCNSFIAGSYEVAKMFKKQNVLYLGGRIKFLQNGLTRNGLMAVNRTNGSLYNWSPFTNSEVIDISGSDSLLFVCGAFDSIVGQPAYKVGALNMFDGTFANINININKKLINQINKISFNNNQLFLGGYFDTLNGVPASSLASIDLLTNSISSWRPNPDGSIIYVGAHENKVIVSGTFSKIGSIERKNLVALDMISGMPNTLNVTPNGKILSLSQVGNKLFIAGEFDSVNSIMRNSLAAIDLDLGNVLPFNAGLNSKYDVLTLHSDSSDLYVGGLFSQIMGQPRSRIASINFSSFTLNAFSLPLAGTVRRILKNNNLLYLIGSWSWNSSPVGLLYALGAVDVLTGIPTNLNNNPVGVTQIKCGVLVGDSIYVGGYFNDIGNTQRHNLAMFKLNDGMVGAWNPDPSGNSNSGIYVNAVEAHDSLIFVGGTFPGFPYPSPNSYFAAVDKISGQVSSWRPIVGGHVNSLSYKESKLFIGGDMSYLQPGPTFIKKFLVFAFKTGPGMSSIADIAICSSDTIGPLSISITDSINVNTVSLEVSSSDTSIVKNSDILISGSGALRNITIIPSLGATGYCTLFIKATNQDGGSSYSSFIVHINTATVSISGNPSFCSGDSTTLWVVGGYSSYQWSTGAVTSSTVIMQPGNYTITIINSSGCIASDSVLVVEYMLPSPFITSFSNTNICQGDSVLLNANAGFANYQWLLNNIPIAGATSQAFYANLNGNFTCEVIDSNSCANQSNNIRVRIVCIPWGPNHEKQFIDGSNESFNIAVVPNPSTGDFILTADCFGDEKTEIKIYDSRLKELHSKTMEPRAASLIIEKMIPGIYFLRVQCGPNSKLIKLVQIE